MLSASLLVALAVAGCTQSAPTAKPSASKSSSSSPAPKPSAKPTYSATASAVDNKAYFDYLNDTLFSSNSTANGQQIVENLVSGGFDKAAMQLTPDKTSINGNVDSVLFSVKIGADCLLGQHGSSGYTSSVAKALANGSCLVGKTRTIDF